MTNSDLWSFLPVQCYNLKIIFTQNEKKSSDDYEQPSIIYYRPCIVVFFFTFKKVGQSPSFLDNAIEYIFQILRKDYKILHDN